MKKTKLALLHSVIALLLCCSMLIGTTFAWFTDSVTSGINRIAAGNLDVELEYLDKNGNWKPVREDTNVFAEDTLWEPGHTEVVYLKISNLGSLALKYRLGVNIVSETPSLNKDNGLLKLSDHIRYGIETGRDGKTNAWADRTKAVAAVSGSAKPLSTGYTGNGKLYAQDNCPTDGQTEHYVAMVVYMPETVGNEANYKTGENPPKIELGISLVATQQTAEQDSFGSDYDEQAKFPTLKPGSVTVDVQTENGKVSQQVTMEGETILASVPAGVKVKDGVGSLTLSVSEMSGSNANIPLEENEILRSLDVHMEGVAADNTVPMLITVEKAMMTGLNIGNYTLYHVENGAPVQMTYVSALADLDAHNEFFYDPATGDVTMALATFSEVAVVAEPSKWEGNFDYSWYKADATELTIANADQLAAFGAIVGGMAKNQNDKFLITYTDSDGDEHHNDSFSGKTVKLISDINLGDDEEHNNPDIIFYPIGYWNNEGTYERKPLEERTTAVESGFYAFEGTFDGNGNTIANFYQNTWEMKGDHNWYDPVKEQYYRDGMGLFGKVYGGTVKNLTVKNFSSDGEIATTGVIAAYADGATFENIAIFNCNPRVYNIGNGGIVGCVGWYAKNANLKTTFTNITVDNSNKISALWGSYDVACGGIVGQYYPTSGQTSAGTPKNAGVEFKNCHVSAVMDVYNDVCANYQYYAYRYTGMLIGSVRENETIDGRVYPKMDGITASGCTVHFGDWNDYYYCELVANTTASYTHDHQMSRLTQVASVDVENMKVTDLDGNTTDIPTSGRVNYVVVKAKDANGMWIHGDGHNYAECYHFVDGAVWNHEDAGYHDGTDGGKIVDENGDGVADLKEDKQLVYREFNQLFTGYGWGVTSKGLTDYVGVTNMDITAGKYDESVQKFTANSTVPEIKDGTTVTVGDLFTAVDNPVVPIDADNVRVFVSPLNSESTVSVNYVPNTDDWTQGILTFSGSGSAEVIVTDYYYCVQTKLTISIGTADKFAIKLPNVNTYLYRVGNANAVSVASLFMQNAEYAGTINSANVDISVTDLLTGNSMEVVTKDTATWTNGSLNFGTDYTGVVKVTISGDNATAVDLYLEVVDATNVTGLSGTISGNVVLLNDCGLSSLTVSGRYAVYGNGFTATYTGNGQYLNNGLKQGVVTVSENGTLDNLRIEASVYPVAYLYYSEAQKGESDGNNRYYYQLSAVAATGNATISSCYIYGGRTNIYIGDGNVTVKDCVLECGTLANVQIISSENYTVTFEDVTTIQHQMNATIDDTSKVMLGAGILVGDGDKDNTTATAPSIVLNGNFKQYNWVNVDDKNAVSDSNAQMIINGALNATDYNHTVNGKTASNMGIICLNDFQVAFTNNTELPYAEGTVGLTLTGATVYRSVYSLKSASESQIYSDFENAERSTVNSLYQPQFKYPTDLGGQHVEKTDDGDEHCYREGDTIKVMFPAGDTKELDLAALVNIAKYSGQNLNLSISCKDTNSNSVTVNTNKVSLSAAGIYTVTYTVTDTLFYDKDGKTYTNSIQYSWNVTVEVALKETGIPNAYFEFNTNEQQIFRSGDSNIVQFIPFLSGLKIYDYDENGVEYLRFDGGTTTMTTDYNKISSATINNIKTTGEGEGYHIVTIEFTDGGKLTIDMDVRANSGSSTHSGSIKVRNEVIYVVNNGTTSGKGQTWKIYNYSFVGNNGTQIDSGLVTFGTAGEDCDIATKPTANFGEESPEDNCISAGTLITLADGTQKKVEDLLETDLVRVFNHETGAFETMPLLYYVNDGVAEYDIINLKFNNGTTTRLIYEHALFDMTLNRYVYIREDNYESFVGHVFAMDDGNGGFKGVVLAEAFMTTEVTGCYSITSMYHLNYYIDGILSLPGGIEGLFNYFEYDPVTLQYDQEKMAADIEQYGLYTYDDFAEYATQEMFNSIIPAQYLKVAVGKGLITFEGILELFHMYLV